MAEITQALIETGHRTEVLHALAPLKVGADIDDDDMLALGDTFELLEDRQGRRLWLDVARRPTASAYTRCAAAERLLDAGETEAARNALIPLANEPPPEFEHAARVARTLARCGAPHEAWQLVERDLGAVFDKTGREADPGDRDPPGRWERDPWYRRRQDDLEVLVQLDAEGARALLVRFAVSGVLSEMPEAMDVARRLIDLDENPEARSLLQRIVRDLQTSTQAEVDSSDLVSLAQQLLHVSDEATAMDVFALALDRATSESRTSLQHVCVAASHLVHANRLDSEHLESLVHLGLKYVEEALIPSSDDGYQPDISGDDEQNLVFLAHLLATHGAQRPALKLLRKTIEARALADCEAHPLTIEMLQAIESA